MIGSNNQLWICLLSTQDYSLYTLNLSNNDGLK